MRQNETPPKKSLSGLLLSNLWMPILLGNIVLFIILAVAQPAFLRTTNIINILGQSSLYGIMAVGMVFVISTGGVDISVGMHAFFIMSVMYRLALAGMPSALVFICAMVLGTLIGIINGTLIAFFHLPPMIATLSVMSVCRGIGYTLIGSMQRLIQPNIAVIGASKLFGLIPLSAIIMVCIAICGAFVLKRTRLGRYVLALGGSEDSAMYTGIPVKMTKVGAYAICGFCVAIAAIVYAGRVGSVQPDSCQGYEFSVITAVVIGGTKITGGKSSIAGAIMGSIFLYLLENAMTMMEIPAYYQYLARGIMMFGAIAIDTATNFSRKKAASHERAKRLSMI